MGAARFPLRRALRSAARARATTCGSPMPMSADDRQRAAVRPRANSNAAKRFILLVDTLYDRGVKLAASFAVPLDELGQDDRTAAEFAAHRVAPDRDAVGGLSRGAAQAREPQLTRGLTCYPTAHLPPAGARVNRGANYTASGIRGGCMARKKIALIGAGQIGGTLAHLVATQRAGRRHPVRHRRRRAAGQGARSQPVRPGRRLQRHASRARPNTRTSPAPTW